jgi:hypothetical protein
MSVSCVVITCIQTILMSCMFMCMSCIESIQMDGHFSNQCTSPVQVIRFILIHIPSALVESVNANLHKSALTYLIKPIVKSLPGSRTFQCTVAALKVLNMPKLRNFSVIVPIAKKQVQILGNGEN